MNSKSVLLISVGPVQGFIAASRRSRDLRGASWLLSELSRTAARAVRDLGGEVVFPSSLEDDSPAANKIVAVVTDAPVAGDAASSAVRRRIVEAADTSLTACRELIDWAAAIRQLEDLPEVVWAFAPVTSGYAEARRTAESLLAARKSLRDFRAPTWGSEKPKSSLDGQRESVIDESIYPSRRDGDEKRLRFAGQAARLGIKGSERLCGPGLLKRHLRSGGSFPSTSGVAASGVNRRLVRDHAVDRQNYLDTLESLNAEYTREPFDAIVFVEEQLKEVVGPGEVSQAQKALHDLIRSTEVRRPVPYYAILAADGDHIGALIERLETVEDHQRLSQALAGFSSSASRIIESAHGSVIYAGGDDVLALLPLDTALACASELEREFRSALSMFVAPAGHPHTISAGLAVSHYADSLGDALALARAAEAEAKHVHGRGAIHVVVSKRSGSDTGFGGKWDSAIEILELFTTLHVHDEIPDGFAYQLRDVTRRLDPSGNSTKTGPVEVLLEHEALRLIGRKRSGDGSRKLAEDVSAALRGRVAMLGSDALHRALIVARMFADAQRSAGNSAATSTKEVAS
ncbi:MAG: type III-B CRISPR-associated protein Cas10/Cmr2 [Acidobacteria bacterium]|nr:type III-B CRISPR-associated protein Cas10/Cmr2 [Acidobacteriota bacterium]